MTTIVLGPRPPLVEAWLAERRAKGLDGFDEVWEGEYVASSMARSSHGMLDPHDRSRQKLAHPDELAKRLHWPVIQEDDEG